MGENYVELPWRVIAEGCDGFMRLKGAFEDLADAQNYAEQIGGKVIVVTHKEIAEESDDAQTT